MEKKKDGRIIIDLDKDGVDINLGSVFTKLDYDSPNFEYMLDGYLRDIKKGVLAVKEAVENGKLK